MHIRTLHDGWQFCPQSLAPDYPQPQLQRPGWMPARIPGAVHLDLVREGVIGDPFYRQGEIGAAWVDETDWSYRTTFAWSPTEGEPRRVLRFGGLDTVCEIFLNGGKIGESDNMFLPLEIDVTDLLKPDNELRIDFRSAVREGVERRRAYFEAHGLAWGTAWFDERAFVRKAGYMSGWDWGPRLVSCGIWGQVELLEFAGRIKAVSFLQERLESGRFRVWAEAETEGSGAIVFEVAGQTFGPGESVELQPDLWWPAGEGPQTLHAARATLGGHTVEKRIGLRTIRLLREEDEHGRSFEFEVNGRKVYARGANWIPDDSFVARTDPSRVKAFTRMNFNMLRVWGGGFYESEAFYDACDEAGLMVWQDFPYGCMYYPDSDPEVALARDEAAYHVRRLRDRPSLALWCGNNENEVMWLGPWAERRPRPRATTVSGSTTRRCPRRSRPTATGPTTSARVPSASRSRTLASAIAPSGSATRTTGTCGMGAATGVSTTSPRRASPASTASPPRPPTTSGRRRWRRSTRIPSLPPSGGTTRRARAPRSSPATSSSTTRNPRSLEDWTYYSGLNQRDAMRHGVEHFPPLALLPRLPDLADQRLLARAELGRWEDYHRLLKPAGQEMARVYAPTLVSLVLTAEAVEAWLVHDGPEPETGTLRVAAVDTVDGSLRELAKRDFSLAPGERSKALSLDLSELDRGRTALVATLDDRPATARWAYLSEPKDVQLGTPTLRAERRDDGMVLHVEGFVGDLVVWDESDPRTVLGPWTGLAGRAAVTVANGTAIFPLGGPLTRLRGRSLGANTRSRCRPCPQTL